MYLHSYLCQHYRNGTQKLVRDWEKKLHKKVQCDNSHIFNMRCRDKGVISASLRIKPLVRTREGYRMAEHASRAFLRARVHETYCRKCQLAEEVQRLRSRLERDLENGDYQKVSRLSLATADKTYTRTK